MHKLAFCCYYKNKLFHAWMALISVHVPSCSTVLTYVHPIRPHCKRNICSMNHWSEKAVNGWKNNISIDTFPTVLLLYHGNPCLAAQRKYRVSGQARGLQHLSIFTSIPASQSTYFSTHHSCVALSPLRQLCKGINFDLSSTGHLN